MLIKLYLYLVLFLILGISILHLLPRLGDTGKKLSDRLCYAPGIDLALAYFMPLPLLIGSIIAQWQGVGIALLAEFTSLWIWIFAHESLHTRPKSNIHSTLSTMVGKWRNHLAVWITALAIPLFWLVRLAEIVVYPPLTWLVKLPKYEAKEWVNVSRQKFEGLIGYDLIWCLYCDWMTGVWSLGSEMLRNVESFWCPIRFYPDKKCENCQLDFPDIENGWVLPEGTMEDVTQLLQEKYTANQEKRSWFGHNSRKDK
ncbi:MAG: hypothetical protein ACXITR_03365 [Cyanobacterium sp.]